MTDGGVGVPFRPLRVGGPGYAEYVDRQREEGAKRERLRGSRELYDAWREGYGVNIGTFEEWRERDLADRVPTERERLSKWAEWLGLPSGRNWTEEQLSDATDVRISQLQQEIDQVLAEDAIDAIPVSDPEAIWIARPELQHIMNMARRLKMSPWALLGASLLRAAACVPYWVPFASYKGRRPVNLIMAMTGGTGGGKTAIDQAVSGVFAWPTQLGDALEAGSGEAIAAAYAYVAPKSDTEMGVKKGDTVWRNDDHSLRWMFDEIGRLNAMQGRQGSTVLEYLKSAESGASLGRVLASSEGVQIPSGQYRFVATLNVQPERAHLITSADEAAGGLPGRMLWASTEYRPFVGMARDKRRVTPWPLPHLNWTLVDEIEALPEMEEAFEAQDDAAHAGTLDPMESHGNLLRAKVACCLMVLAGRQALVPADWELAGLILEHSRCVRAKVLRSVAKAEGERVGAGDTHREMAIITAMLKHKKNGLTMGAARKRLRGDQRPLWDVIAAREPDMRW